MKFPVSIVAFLVLAPAVPAGCGAAQASKAQFSEVCLEKMGGSQAKCACYVDSLSASLSPDQFNKTAQAVIDNRRFVGLLPEELNRDGTIESATTTAAKTCFG